MLLKRLALVLGLVGLFAVSAAAQTPVVNPNLVEFSPSPDHSLTAIDQSGQTVNIVTNYVLVVFNPSGVQIASLDLLKPTPGANGLISVLINTFVQSLAPNVTYTAKVNTVGPGGTAASLISNPFVVGGTVTVPRPATGVVLKKLT